MIAPWRRNRLTSTLGIDYPVIQGPLGGLSSQKLTAAVSNFGGLGSLGAHSLAPHAINDAIAQIRSLTSKPFAINLWVSMEDEGARTSDEGAFNRSLALLRHHLAALGAPLPVYTPYVPMRLEDQVRVLLDAHVPVFSFIYGIPPREILDECRNQHIVTIGTATTSDEASVLQEAGVDAIVASGFEAGGHRGSFLRTAEDSLTGTLSLVPRIVDRVNVPGSPREASEMPVASWQLWLSAPRPSRWAQYSSRARNPAPADLTGKHYYAEMRNTPA
jgi:nitronate monooxygenase